MAGDLRKVMPKPNSKKKESVSANSQEDDLPSNSEKSEIENDTLILGEVAHSARKNNQKSSVTCLKLSKTSKFSDFRPGDRFCKNQKYF